MDMDDYFRRVMQDLRNFATYSASHDALVVSVRMCQSIVKLHARHCPPELFTLSDVLEEGARRGCWEMDLDPHSETDIIVFG